MSKKITEEAIELIIALQPVCTWKEIADILKTEFGLNKTFESVRKIFYRYSDGTRPSTLKKPKILLFDIETLPMEAYIWSIWQDNVGLNMLKEDWSVLSYAAKWMGEPEVFYEDVSGQKDLRDDSKVLRGIWKLLDEADYVVGHNSDSFDVKKLNARFALNGMQPPTSYRRLDTKKLAKKHFNFTSNKLSYLTDKFCKTYKKLDHSEMSGFTMWRECLNKNPRAFEIMEEYNKYDVLSLEELFQVFLPWENANLFSLYNHEIEPTCTCGSQEFKKAGFHYTTASKFQKYRCKNCGAEYRDTKNLNDKDKKKMGPTRR